MKDDVSLEKVMGTIKNWTEKKVNIPTPSLLVSLEDGSFHVSYYAGMGNSDSSPLSKFFPLYRATVEKLYEQGRLIETGRAFTLYPGSHRFKSLIFIN
ncbi:hypothetical protein KUL17_27770 [Alteromonas sp. KUL17]|uniref:hypothetical protein n=1 Tax=Alteromonas sp. KUL17 TaxID=2480796 RepID=UPI0010377531|nr:hypothetical protein [Alteromonas sp. KUL17]TAP24823.1 hypothetical protein KUL49_13805 [Alteromonas sp. KUL17]GEA03880.1 hypothetical protein KUL17_27770 [Alteromonas sp. KUL17]